MKVVGYCTSCHKFRYVTVYPSSLAQKIMQGICDQCEKKERDERKKQRA